MRINFQYIDYVLATVITYWLFGASCLENNPLSNEIKNEIKIDSTCQGRKPNFLPESCFMYHLRGINIILCCKTYIANHQLTHFTGF